MGWTWVCSCCCTRWPGGQRWLPTLWPRYVPASPPTSRTGIFTFEAAREGKHLRQAALYAGLWALNVPLATGLLALFLVLGHAGGCRQVCGRRFLCRAQLLGEWQVHLHVGPQSLLFPGHHQGNRTVHEKRPLVSGFSRCDGIAARHRGGSNGVWPLASELARGTVDQGAGSFRRVSVLPGRLHRDRWLCRETGTSRLRNRFGASGHCNRCSGRRYLAAVGRRALPGCFTVLGASRAGAAFPA